LMAGFAVENHEIRLAETHFARAAELAPDQPFHRLNREAFLLTYSQNPEVRAEAARDLESVLTNPEVNLIAVRALLFDAMRSGDLARAQQFAEKLGSLPGRTFSDDLSCLEAVMSQPAFHPALEALEHRAESDPLRTTETGDWLNAHGMSAEALRWFARLPEPIQSNVRVQMTRAESYSATYDWTELEAFLEKCHWDLGEYLRRAMLIRCKRELSQPWKKEWKQLVTEVDATPTDGLLLARLVTGWDWRPETIELLWGASTKPQTESIALQYLWDLYSRTNETGELLRVARAQLKLDPSNPVKKNNEAFLTLLLTGASDRAERLASEAATLNPNVPEWAATYAYALHLAGKKSEAKKVMDHLPAEALKRPGVALYYAIVLAANGEDAKARESLAKLNPNGMLPEEQKLAADLATELKVKAP
ncbi:MAG: hypothetical protein WCH43_04315, partial [Verrucomicrobiota bacterium]